MPFYVLYAGETLGLTGQLLGTVTFAFTKAGTLSNLFWGYLADRTGFRLVFLSSITLGQLQRLYWYFLRASWKYLSFLWV